MPTFIVLQFPIVVKHFFHLSVGQLPRFPQPFRQGVYIRFRGVSAEAQPKRAVNDLRPQPQRLQREFNS